MDIKFILDTIKEQDKKSLKKVIESVEKKPHYYSKEALFMKKFILSLFKQYNYPHKGIIKKQKLRPRTFIRKMPLPPLKIEINALKHAPNFIN